jgi:3-hydroxyacyl-[acyl-carrier-protein] dehydratase
MDINKIKEVLPHRYPFLLIDRIVDYTPDESAHAIKCVTSNEPFFEGHFPGRPLMPGVLVVEAIVQAACFTVGIKMKEEMKNPGVSFMTIDKCKFRKPVTPGDVLNLHVKRLNKVRNVYKFEGKCIVNDVIYAECIFSAMIHDIRNPSL